MVEKTFKHYLKEQKKILNNNLERRLQRIVLENLVVRLKNLQQKALDLEEWGNSGQNDFIFCINYFNMMKKNKKYKILKPALRRCRMMLCKAIKDNLNFDDDEVDRLIYKIPKID